MFPQNYSRYIEVFGGAGWVLFGKTYSAGQLEVFNDADGSLINIYRCIKYHPDALAAELSGLPQSREIFFDWQNQFVSAVIQTSNVRREAFILSRRVLALTDARLLLHRGFLKIFLHRFRKCKSGFVRS